LDGEFILSEKPYPAQSSHFCQLSFLLEAALYDKTVNIYFIILSLQKKVKQKFTLYQILLISEQIPEQL